MEVVSLQIYFSETEMHKLSDLEGAGSFPSPLGEKVLVTHSLNAERTEMWRAVNLDDLFLFPPE
jgi:hypothetical protein